MKSLILPLLLLLAQLTLAQKVTVSGVIKNQEGATLSAAIISDKAGDKAKTDTAGTFKLAVNLPVTLAISCVGYRDTLVSVTTAAQLSITLHIAVNITASKYRVQPDPAKSINMAPLATAILTSTASMNQADNGKNRVVNFNATAGTIFPQFNPKEETQGSRYLYKDWVQGTVINSSGQLIVNKDYQFNYDKMGGGLLATKDGHSAIEIDRDKVRYFSLADDKGDTITFANIPTLDKNRYVQVLTEGHKYGIYKTISTKFERANYTTDGVMSQGNNFDSYTDTYEYYLIDAKTGASKKIVLKKKAIKALVPAETAKLNKYVADHSADTMDDSYITSLGQYLNE
jgi:hypothetical protein